MISLSINKAPFKFGCKCLPWTLSHTILTVCIALLQVSCKSIYKYFSSCNTKTILLTVVKSTMRTKIGNYNRSKKPTSHKI